MYEYETKYEILKEELERMDGVYLKQYKDAVERGNVEMSNYYLGCYETVKEIFEEYFS